MSDKIFHLYLPAFLHSFVLRNPLTASTVNQQQLLEGSGVTRSDLDNPDKKISYDSLAVMNRNAINAWPHPGIGLSFGNALSIMDFGLVGQAMATSPTLKQALDLFLQYYHFRLRIVKVDIDIKDSAIMVVFDVPIEDAKQDRLYIDAALSATIKVITSIYPENFNYHAELKADDGGYPQAYKALFGNNVTFNGKRNAIYLEGIDIYLPLIHSRHLNHLEAIKACEYELRQIPRLNTISDKVLNLLRSDIKTPLTLDVIAKTLGFSPRNLRRHLSHEETSYRNLLNQVRSEYARDRLLNSDMPIGKIANELGYDSRTNFGRAFKGWEGVSPAEYRKTLSR